MPFAPDRYFAFERNWVARALPRMREDVTLISRGNEERARLEIGIGVRQVDSLRDWLQAMDLIERNDDGWVLRRPAMLLLHYDPLLEETGTWAALHYRLASERSRMGIYYWFVNQFPLRRFSDEDLLRELVAADSNDLAVRTLKNCARCLMNVLQRTPLGEQTGLRAVGGDSYGRDGPSSLATSPVLLGYALADWARADGRTTANFAELWGEGAPARIFNLNKDTLDSYLDVVDNRYRKRVVSISRTAGLNSVAFRPDVHPLQILEIYYLEQITGLEPYEAMSRALTDGFALELLAEEEGSDGSG